MLGRVTEDATLFHELYESPPLPSYVRGNIALIGDAAHAMAPNLGRGACEAIVDGVQLARCLESVDLVDGLRRYDRARRRRTQLLVTASRFMGRLATATRGAGIRDALLAAAASLTERPASPQRSNQKSSTA